MVIAGKWETSADSHWNFSIDKQHMTRIVPLRNGIPLTELLSNVFREFFDNSDVIRTAVLSYWPPNSKELATGLTTPPVMLTTDGAVSYFYQHFQANKGMNLFVTFNIQPQPHPISHVDENPLSFTTPNQPLKRTHSPYSSSALRHPSTVGSQIPGFSLFTDDVLNLSQGCLHVHPQNSPHVHPQSSPPVRPPSCPPVHRPTAVSHIPGSSVSTHDNLDQEFPVVEDSGLSKTNRYSLLDETLFCQDELLQKMFKEDPNNIPDSWATNEDEEDEDTASDASLPADIPGVQTRGYDQDFWAPLIGNPLGGSDAAEVMAGIAVPKTAPHIIHCTTGDAFDHTVLVSGELPPYCKPEVGSSQLPVHPRSCPPVQPRSVPSRTPQSCPPVRRSSAYTSSARTSYTDPHPPHPPTPTPRETRPLSEISDEEFDVPPLFDDTLFEAEDVPDLDIDDDEPFVGKLYASKEDCQIGLAIYAIKEQFYFRQTRTSRHFFVLSCHDTRCEWRIRAKELTSCGYYTIQKCHLDHTCDTETRRLYKKRATSKVLAHIYRSKYCDVADAPKALQLQQLVLEDLRVSASYMKCHRAKGVALDITHGNAEDSYLNIAGYFDRLKATNPGTVTAIETELDDNGDTRFLYAFLSFGASIQGFRRLRPVLIIDGTHLSGKYKGVLLTASGQDGNFQVFPLAFAVVDGETEEAWTWFLTKLERIIADSNTLTIISDRHASIIKAITLTFPKAHHGSCIVHLMRNVVSRFKSKGLAKMVCEAAFSFRRSDFDANFKKIKQASAPCFKYLEDIGTAKWSRTYFPGNRYNLLTSNVAEQLNKAISKSRPSPIVEMFMFIQRMLTRWFSARRTKSAKHRGFVTPEVDKVMQTHIRLTKGSKIYPAKEWTYSVRGLFGHPNTVHLDTKVCTCQVFQKLKIPCGHAMLAADSIGLPYTQLVGDCYKTQQWIDTYSGVILPEAPVGDHPIPPDIADVTINPPKTRRPSGRPKENRIPSTGEVQVSFYSPYNLLLIHIPCLLTPNMFSFRLPRNQSSSPTNVAAAVALAITALAVLFPSDSGESYIHITSLLDREFT